MCGATLGEPAHRLSSPERPAERGLTAAKTQSSFGSRVSFVHHARRRDHVPSPTAARRFRRGHVPLALAGQRLGATEPSLDRRRQAEASRQERGESQTRATDGASRLAQGGRGNSAPVAGQGGADSGVADANRSPGGISAPSGPVAARAVPEDNVTYHPDAATTATKTNTPIMDTPASIQVVPRAVMQDQQATELSQAVNNVSGVIAADERQANAQTFWIRGFLTYQYYLDGARMVSDYSQTAQELANVDRVEVLKGPASILYGRGEPGGIINVVTKVPLEKPYSSVQQEAGSWYDYRTTIDTTGPLTKDNTLLYRFDFAYQNNKNFDNVVAARNAFFAPKLRWNLDAHNFIDGFVTYNYRMWPDVSDAPSFTGLGPSSQNPLYAIAFGTTPLSFLPRSFNANPPWSRLNQDEIVTGVNSSHDLNENWNIKTRFQTQLVSYVHPYAGPSSWDPVLPFQLNNFPFLTTGWNTYNYYTNFLLTGNFQTSVIDHTLLIGGDLQKWGQDFISISQALTQLVAFRTHIYLRPYTHHFHLLLSIRLRS